MQGWIGVPDQSPHKAVSVAVHSSETLFHHFLDNSSSLRTRVMPTGCRGRRVESAIEPGALHNDTPEQAACDARIAALWGVVGAGVLWSAHHDCSRFAGLTVVKPLVRDRTR
jgi:hypothetical protein